MAARTQLCYDVVGYAFVQHTEDKHPHVHFVVQMRGFDGTRLDPRKVDLQRWREGFAEQLRDHGIEAAATPRRARGIAKKTDKQAIVQMRERGIKPNVDVGCVKDAIEHLAKGATELRWEKAIVDRQQLIRATYRSAAATLAAEPAKEDREMGARLEAFVQTMPECTTRRGELVKTMKDHVEAARKKSITQLQKDQSASDPER